MKENEMTKGNIKIKFPLHFMRKITILIVTFIDIINKILYEYNDSILVEFLKKTENSGYLIKLMPFISNFFFLYATLLSRKGDLNMHLIINIPILLLLSYQSFRILMIVRDYTKHYYTFAKIGYDIFWVELLAYLSFGSFVFTIIMMIFAYFLLKNDKGLETHFYENYFMLGITHEELDC